MAVNAMMMPRRNWMQKTEMMVALFIVAIVTMMVIPFAPFIIDIMIVFNITLALMILLSVIYIKKSIELSAFPSILLILTLFRLGINVSTARAILLGNGSDIKVVSAFGEYVIGGNYVVGIIIFIILIVIQFVVIVRGANRVSEVAARFTLDAMPVKLMSVDADLNAGVVTEKEANEKRKEIRQEADFYGAMDGAAKFVQGDVIAGLIITFVNIIGGLCIGVFMYRMEVTTALSQFTILTIGDGLAVMISSLLMSTATGLIVTKAASDSDLSSDLVRQISSQPRSMAIASAFLFGMAIFTGFPKIPLIMIATGAAILSYYMRQSIRTRKEEETKQEQAKKIEEMKKPENVIGLLQIDPLELEIGIHLIPLVDASQGGDLLDRITNARKQIALEMGFVVPPIRIRDNIQLKPGEYCIKIRGVEIAKGEVFIDMYLAMNPGTVKEKIEGRETVEPAFGLPATWIKESQRQRAEMLQYTVVDPPSVMITHLTEMIKRHAPEILGRQEVQALVDNLKTSYPSIIEEVVPNKLSMSDLQKILGNLLAENISIRNLVTIFETLADKIRYTSDVNLLTEHVRVSLARQICQQFRSSENSVSVIAVDPELEETLAGMLQETADGSVLAMEPKLGARILNSISQEYKNAMEQGNQGIVLCSPKIRRHLKKLTQRMMPNIVVLSYNEILQNIQVESIGTVRI